MSAVTFSSTDDLVLEGEIDGLEDGRSALVLCHPHPQMGGTMNAPLLLALRDELVTRSWAVLRFNFRGIGGSQGRPSTGEAEVSDALGAIAFLRARARDLPRAVAGWSFGGAVAVRAAVADDALLGCVGIAPAVVAKPDVTAGLPPADELDLGVPLLFVCGSNDDVVPPDVCRRWIRAVPEGELIEIGAANHFFWGKYDQLSEAVGDWLDARR
jgi:alpha/beta superfamily hydrolase